MKDLPKYIEEIQGKQYCLLQGELDKENFEDQCAKCPVKDKCTIVHEIYKKVSGDWHAINAGGFFGDIWTQEKDKYERKEMRTISKICGLALLYGGSAYSLMRNMDCTQDLAQSRIDSFFSKLTTLNQYMINIKRKVLETGQVYNLFGRRRDMSKWAFSKAASFKQRRQDQAYAERTGLNHPIQSTAAEVLKIEMVRVDEYIKKNNLNPLYGMSPPRHIDLNKVSYKDFKLSMLASIHDELDYYFREDQFDILIPEVYKVMQIKDVVKGFGVDFDLELDVEYDSTRSFTSTKAYPASKIFLLMRLNSKNFSEETESNTIMLKFEDINDSLLSHLDNFNKDIVSEDQKVYNLGVEAGDQIYFHNIKFPEEIFEQFNITYRKIFIEGF